MSLLLLITVLIAYIKVKRWADTPTPAKPVAPTDTRPAPADTDRDPDQRPVGSDWHARAIPWLVFFGCVLIFGVEASIVVVATVYAVKLGTRAARQHAARRNRLIADAIKQHNQIMSGDAAGIYGNYPPAC